VSDTLIAAILQSAGMGTAIIVILIMMGFLDPKKYTNRLEKEADGWRTAYEASRAENEELRRLAAIHAERADTAAAVAQRATETLERLIERTSHADTPTPIRRKPGGGSGRGGAPAG
jgi:hypothetical protein